MSTLSFYDVLFKMFISVGFGTGNKITDSFSPHNTHPHFVQDRYFGFPRADKCREALIYFSALAAVIVSVSMTSLCSRCCQLPWAALKAKALWFSSPERAFVSGVQECQKGDPDLQHQRENWLIANILCIQMGRILDVREQMGL